MISKRKRTGESLQKQSSTQADYDYGDETLPADDKYNNAHHQSPCMRNQSGNVLVKRPSLEVVQEEKQSAI